MSKYKNIFIKSMKTMNLNAAGVIELSGVEMREIDGGWIKEVVDAIVDICKNWDLYVADFNKGFAAGQKIIK
jgi:hypothetical protein